MPVDDAEYSQVILGRARYLGGCSLLGPVRENGLTVNAEAVLFGASRLGMKLVKSVDVGGGEVAKSKLAAALLLGVWGGVTAKDRKDRTDVMFHLHSGEAAFFMIDKANPFAVRAKLLPILRAAGVPFMDEVGGQTSRPDTQDQVATRGLLDDLERLAELQERGFLTAEEVATAKAKLLG
jgi:hypothetical protein